MAGEDWILDAEPETPDQARNRQFRAVACWVLGLLIAAAVAGWLMTKDGPLP